MNYNKPFCPHCKQEDALIPSCDLIGWFCSKCGKEVLNERANRILEYMDKNCM